ncbi:branched-chain amino acid transport system II carrier protein [Syntrophomonas erecta subsp. sporosyntropha]
MNKENIVKLSPIVLLAIAGSVFAMHYGASCMLWPTTWGRNSQSLWYLGFAGFFFTGLLLPFLGYFAVEKAGGPLFTIASRVGPGFAQTFGGFTVLLMGPFFVIPRMSAAAWDALSKIFALEGSPWIVVVIFTIVYYAITYWFIYVETNIVDKVSKILVPVLLVLELAIIFKALTNPLGVPGAPLYDQHPFAYGFVNGYQTMDLPAALMFAGIILADIAHRVKNHKPSVMHNLIKAGVTGFIILTIIEVGEFALGASTGATLADVDYAKLFATIVLIQWGKIGGAVFNVALVFAAMTTAIGLTAGTAQYFVDASHGKWKYQHIAIITLIVSTLISVCGLEQIITFTAPLLNMIYPPCIALVLFTVFATRYVGAMKGACYLTFLWGIVEAIRGYMAVGGIENGMQGLYNVIPFANSGFGWIIFFVVGAIAGHFIFKGPDASDNIDGNTAAI